MPLLGARSKQEDGAEGPTPHQLWYRSARLQYLLRNAVLPFADAAAGHRLGVNGLAVDTTRSLL